MPLTPSRRGVLTAGVTSAGALLGLSACSAGSGTEPASIDLSEPVAEDVSGALTYVIWNPDQEPFVQQCIDAFTAHYPQVTVTLSVVPFNQYWTRLQTQATGHELPDLFWMNGPNFQLYASEGQLMDLEGLYASGQLDKSQYPPSMIDLYTLEDSTYGVPKDFDTIGVWYNRRLFDEADEPYPDGSWDWDEFRATAGRLTDALDGVHGAAISFQGNQESYYNAIYQNGGFVISEDGTRSGYAEPEAIEALAFFQEMIDDGLIPSVNQDTDTPADQLFANGGAAMSWGGSWRAPALATSPDAEHFAATDLPRRTDRASILHGLSNVVAYNTAHPEAAVALASFLGGQEAANILASTGAVIPALTSEQQVWVDSQPSMDLDVFLRVADEYAVPMPASLNTVAWSGYEPDYILSALSGDQPLDRAMHDLGAAVDAQLEEERA
ncbi:ABC transporter substrate-binding protein [Brachybacterium tyrofermentans]|uniref:ABC transporter substrate-binding protein n=1 Tax=Brachybacterium tyrofermentans TaxID=47848 RepID=UPI003FD29565